MFDSHRSTQMFHNAPNSTVLTWSSYLMLLRGSQIVSSKLLINHHYTMLMAPFHSFSVPPPPCRKNGYQRTMEGKFQSHQMKRVLLD